MVASEAPPCALRSDPERADPQLGRHQPHQAPGQRFLERPAVELLPFRGIQRHHPAGMVDVPLAIAPTVRDFTEEGILQNAAFECRIDAGVRNRAGEISGKDRTFGSAHQRCSIHQESAHTAPHAALMPTPMIRTSTKSLTWDVGFDNRSQATTGAKRAARGTSSADKSHVMEASYCV